MKILLLTLAVLLLAGVCCLNKLGERYRKASMEVVRLEIMVKNQEPWIEGFMRKLFRLSRAIPRLEIIVVDDGSSDQTREVLARLQRVYDFDLALVRECNDTVSGGSGSRGHLFDAKGLHGNDLLNATVFSQLKAINAGKSPRLSK